MAIRFNPGCPCCGGGLSVLTGVYCVTHSCVLQGSSMSEVGQFYASVKKLYFPPQKITLRRLGYGTSYFLNINFTPDSAEVGSYEIKQTKYYDSVPLIANTIKDYLSSEWVGPDGELKVYDIEEDIKKTNPSFEGLKGRPPAFIFADSETDRITWYEIVYDLKEYGIVKKIFSTTPTPLNPQGVFTYENYYTLNAIDFPIAKDLPSICASPCIAPRSILAYIYYGGGVVDGYTTINPPRTDFGGMFIYGNKTVLETSGGKPLKVVCNLVNTSADQGSIIWTSDEVDFVSWKYGSKLIGPGDSVDDPVTFTASGNAKCRVSIIAYAPLYNTGPTCDINGDTLNYSITTNHKFLFGVPGGELVSGMVYNLKCSPFGGEIKRTSGNDILHVAGGRIEKLQT